MREHPRRRHLGRNPDDGREGVAARPLPETRRVLDAVLEAEDGGTLGEVRRERARRLFRVPRLHGDEDEARSSRCSGVRRRGDAHALRERRRLEEEALGGDRVDVARPSDERDRDARPGQHPAEVAPDRARAEDGDAVAAFGAFSSLKHAAFSPAPRGRRDGA